MWKVLFNTKQLREWVEATKAIRARFGIEKALGYLIGEKFYRVACTLHYHKQLVRMIAEQRKQPGYNPVFETVHNNHKIVNNLDKIYEENIVITADTGDHSQSASGRFSSQQNDDGKNSQARNHQFPHIPIAKA